MRETIAESDDAIKRADKALEEAEKEHDDEDADPSEDADERAPEEAEREAPVDTSMRPRPSSPGSPIATKRSCAA